jgi:hypothetical protein
VRDCAKFKCFAVLLFADIHPCTPSLSSRLSSIMAA